MKQWAQGMKQWSLWLVGEAPLPGKRARKMLGVTLGIALLVVAGLAVATRRPARTGEAAVSNSSSGVQTSATAPSSSPANALPNSGGSTTTTTVTGTGTASPHSRPPRTSSTGKAKAVKPGSGKSGGTKNTATVTPTTEVTPTPQVTPTTEVAHGAVSLPMHAPMSPTVTQPTAQPLILTPLIASVATSTGVPGAPIATHASSGHGASVVRWARPSSNGGSAITGYNVYVGTSPGVESASPANGASLITWRSYRVTGLTAGQTYYFTVRAVNASGLSAASNEVSASPRSGYASVTSLTGPIVGMAANTDGTGYWLVDSQGAVTARGAVTSYGSMASNPLNAPIVQIVATPDDKGYWEVAADGGVFAFGDAHFLGSMSGAQLYAPVVGLAPTQDGEGYWEVASDGEHPTVGGHLPVALAVLGRSQAHHGGTELGTAHRPEEVGVAEGEHPTVGGHFPVSLVVRSGHDLNDGGIQRIRGHRPIAGDRATSGPCALRVDEPVAGAVGVGRHPDDRSGQRGHRRIPGSRGGRHLIGGCREPGRVDRPHSEVIGLARRETRDTVGPPG